MKKALLALVLGISVASCAQPPTLQEEIELERGLRLYGYRVVRVLDGNTIVIDLNDQNQLREVRLIGVEAPRYKKEFREGGGQDAGVYLHELIFNRPATGEEENEDGKVYVRLGFEGWRYGPLQDHKTLRPRRDAHLYPAGAVLNRTGQIEAYVYIEGRCINRLLIDSGYARVDRRNDFSKKEEFFRAEDRAKSLKIGLWLWVPEEPLAFPEEAAAGANVPEGDSVSE